MTTLDKTQTRFLFSCSEFFNETGDYSDGWLWLKANNFISDNNYATMVSAWQSWKSDFDAQPRNLQGTNPDNSSNNLSAIGNVPNAPTRPA